MPTSLSWGQALLDPCSSVAPIADPVVEPIGPTLPELVHLRQDTESPPAARPGDVPVGILLLERPEPLLELFPAGDVLLLRRGGRCATGTDRVVGGVYAV